MIALFSFLAGILTVLSPCVLPLLPIIISGGIGAKNYIRPLLITLGLSISLFIFTVFIKTTTLWFDVPNVYLPFRFPTSGAYLNLWQFISALILIIFGVFYLKPEWWERVARAVRLEKTSGEFMQKAGQKESWYAPFIVGFALGPVFTSCSPTYALLLSVVLPNNFVSGIFYVLLYCLGLGLILFLIAIFGQRITRKMQVLADSESKFKKVLSWIFILVGLAILTGFDRYLQTIITSFLVENNLDITAFEEKIKPNIK